MWKELLESLSSECEFNPSATPEAIAEGEISLSATFPEELRTILGESDGVYGEYKLGLLWPLEQIVQDNLMFRSHEEFPELYMPFESLLFFCDDGGGDQFAFTVLAGKVRKPDIFVWNHEDDSRTWVAPSLKVFYEWWLTGKLNV